MTDAGAGTSREFRLRPIGTVHRRDDRLVLAIDESYRPALRGLDGFSHAQIFWWFDRVADARVPDWAADWPDAMPDEGLALDRTPGERRG